MTPFNRRVFEKAKVRKIFARARSRPAYFADIDTSAIEKKNILDFEVNQLLFSLDLILGGSIAKTLLTKNTSVVLNCTNAILENFVREGHNVKVQDLQLTLICNLIIKIAKTTRQPLAAMDGIADSMIRECGLESDFKLAVRQQLFDNQIIDQPFLKIIYYP